MFDVAAISKDNINILNNDNISKFNNLTLRNLSAIIDCTIVLLVSQQCKEVRENRAQIPRILLRWQNSINHSIHFVVFARRIVYFSTYADPLYSTSVLTLTYAKSAILHIRPSRTWSYNCYLDMWQRSAQCSRLV